MKNAEYGATVVKDHAPASRTSELYRYYKKQHGFDAPFYLCCQDVARDMNEKGKNIFKSVLELACNGLLEIHTDQMAYPDDDVQFSLKRRQMSDEEKIESLERLCKTASRFRLAYAEFLCNKPDA